MGIQLDTQTWRQIVDEMLKDIRKQIDGLREKELAGMKSTEEQAGILKGLRMARELLK